MSKNPLTISQKEQVAEYLLGSCASSSETASVFNLDPFDGASYIEEAAEQNGVILCHECGWWVEEHDCSWDIVPGEPVCSECEHA